jgi:hypothetical protein
MSANPKYKPPDDRQNLGEIDAKNDELESVERAKPLKKRSLLQRLIDRYDFGLCGTN